MAQKLHKNIFSSLMAQGLPALFALLTIPALIRSYGTERFGLLTLLWVFLTYLSFLDLGIARALTKSLATEKTHNISRSGRAIIKLSFLLILITSALGLFVVLGGREYIINSYLQVSPKLRDEATNSLLALGLAIPALLIFSLQKSIAEGLHLFNQANMMQFGVGISNYLAPFACLALSERIDVALFALMTLRWILVIFGHNQIHPHLGFRILTPKIQRTDLKQLLHDGFWFSLITLINPLLVFLDRFLIASRVPMTEMAYYTTPFEIVTRFWLIPMAVTRILFPVFSSYSGQWSPEVGQHFRKGLVWVAALLVPPFLILFFGGGAILSVWAGKDFQENSFQILQILSVGVFVNCFNWITFTFVQASKHIWLTVLVPLFELILFLVAFFPAVDQYGVKGAAYVWSGRLIFDAFSFAIILFYIVKKPLHSA